MVGRHMIVNGDGQASSDLKAARNGSRSCLIAVCCAGFASLESALVGNFASKIYWRLYRSYAKEPM